MIIGYYEEIYRAYDVNERELFQFLRRCAQEDIIKDTDGDSKRSIKDVILERIDDYINFYINAYLFDKDLVRNENLISHQLKEFVLNNIIHYI